MQKRTIVIILIPLLVLAETLIAYLYLFWGLPVEICSRQFLVNDLGGKEEEFTDIKTFGWTGGPLSFMKIYYIAFSFKGSCRFLGTKSGCTISTPKDEAELKLAKAMLLETFSEESETISSVNCDDSQMKICIQDPARPLLTDQYYLLVSPQKKRGYLIQNSGKLPGGL